MTVPILSLVTGKVGRDASFERLVRSIANNTGVSWELVVSDASDEPYRPELLNIRVIPENPRLTCVKGYNAAFKAAEGKWCLYLNDDAEVLPGYAETAIQFMEAHPNIGLGALHYSEDGGPFHVNEAWKVIYANFGIIRRSLGNQIHWFDDTLRMYGSDNSLTFRVLMAGYGVSDIPGARVIHHSVKDETRVENQRYRRYDNDMLTETYMPSRRYWQQTFQLNYVNTGTIPWSHGVEPKVMSVAR